MFVVYDKKTGKAIELTHAVDAKEWVATGKYSDTKPVKKAPAKPAEE